MNGSLLIITFLGILLGEIGFGLSSNHFKFNDDILYGINWFEKPFETNGSESVVMKTSNAESYSCQLPISPKPKHSDYQNDDYVGPTEFELLKKLFDNKVCSTKEGPYWYYEVCHGKHVRQFHEALETSGKAATIQEYYLGHYQTDEVPIVDKKDKKPKMTINSLKLPYYSIKMPSGDYCDLIGRPRSVEVLYFCHENIQANLYDFQEIRTCEYQALVFTKHLCEHPAYKMRENFVNDISCFPLNGAPVIPKSLSNIEKEIKTSENIVSSVESIIDTSKVEPQIKVEAFRKNGIIYYRIIQTEKSETGDSKSKEKPEQQEETKATPLPAGKSTGSVGQSQSNSEENAANDDESPVNSILSESNTHSSNTLLSRIVSGKYCFESGVNYWRNRVCFLKKISQFHVEVEVETQEIIMGFWNEDNHLKWLEDHPMMKPKFPVEDRNDLYQFYSDGNYCEEIKANRRAILKISCVNDNSSSVTVTVSEPNICSYIVIIKGSVFCPLVRQADEFGLIKKSD